MKHSSKLEGGDTWTALGNNIHGAPKKGENGGLPRGSALRQSWNTAQNSKVEITWTALGNNIHGAPKKCWEWRIALSNHYPWLQTRRWRTHERKRNSWGSEKGLRWRIALSNHYAWLQTRRWRTHERKRNSWGSEKGLRMDNCTKQSLRMAPNSKVEDA